MQVKLKREVNCYLTKDKNWPKIKKFTVISKQICSKKKKTAAPPRKKVRGVVGVPPTEADDEEREFVDDAGEADMDEENDSNGDSDFHEEDDVLPPAKPLPLSSSVNRALSYWIKSKGGEK